MLDINLPRYTNDLIIKAIDTELANLVIKLDYLEEGTERKITESKHGYLTWLKSRTCIIASFHEGDSIQVGGIDKRDSEFDAESAQDMRPAPEPDLADDPNNVNPNNTSVGC